MQARCLWTYRWNMPLPTPEVLQEICHVWQQVSKRMSESCDAFHPKICRNSMNDGACYNTSCKHRHLKNTQRQLQIEVSDSNAIHNKLNKRSFHPPDIRDVHVAPTPGFKQTMFEQNMSKNYIIYRLKYA